MPYIVYSLVIAVLLILSGSAAAEPVTVTLVDRLDDGRRIGYWLQLRAGGGEESLVMLDTGARGLMIHASQLGPEVQRTGRRVKQAFQDGTIFEGEVVKASLAMGAVRSREPIYILAIDKISCRDDLPGCPGVRFWRKPLSGVLGVGLGEVNSLDNPLAYLDPELSNGFIVRGGADGRPSTLVLGLSEENSSGFAMFPTPKRSITSNWQEAFYDSNALNGCITIDSAAPFKSCGRILLDSGSSLSLVRLPGRRDRSAGRNRSHISPGTPIILSLKGVGETRLTAGESSWTDRIAMSVTEKGPSILGAGFFQHFNVLYDLKRHAIGLRPSRT